MKQPRPDLFPFLKLVWLAIAGMNYPTTAKSSLHNANSGHLALHRLQSLACHSLTMSFFATVLGTQASSKFIMIMLWGALFS